MSKQQNTGAPVVIKKYANRRLYNTATSSYVTLENLSQMVRDGVEFEVFDAKSGEDITHAVLTQIIFEEESKGHNLLPVNFLRELIKFYDDSLQTVLPDYLELSMANFSENQDQMRQYLSKTFDGMLPFQNFEEIGKRNMEMFQQAMTTMNPFKAEQASNPAAAATSGEGQNDPTQDATPGAPNGAAMDNGAAEDNETVTSELDILREQLRQMQSQLDRLSGGK